jgi:hypothetical protein
MVWLYKLPDSCIALLFGVIGAALFVGVLFLRVKLLRIQVQSDHAKAAHDALTVVIGFVGLILAFSLVQEQNNLRNLEAQVGTEANNLDQLDRLIVRFGTPGDDALRISLREYANSILKDEWPELRRGGPSVLTTRQFRELSRDFSAIDPAPGRQSLIYADILKKVDELASARESRLIAAANIRLAPIFWQTVVFLFLVLFVLAAFSESTFSPGAAMALGCQGFALTLLVALIFIFDRPFNRHNLSPRPIKTAIAEMQNRTSTGR